MHQKAETGVESHPAYLDNMQFVDAGEVLKEDIHMGLRIKIGDKRVWNKAVQAMWYAMKIWTEHHA